MIMEAITGILGTATIGLAKWAVGVESRLNVTASKAEDLKELISTKVDHLDKRLDRIETTLSSIAKRGE